ncbi:putative ubiquitin carboxyl-terminal hydrolase FAF-X [Saitoella coloradoensis]
MSWRRGPITPFDNGFRSERPKVSPASAAGGEGTGYNGSPFAAKRKVGATYGKTAVKKKLPMYEDDIFKPTSPPKTPNLGVAKQEKKTFHGLNVNSSRKKTAVTPVTVEKSVLTVKETNIQSSSPVQSSPAVPKGNLLDIMASEPASKFDPSTWKAPTPVKVTHISTPKSVTALVGSISPVSSPPLASAKPVAFRLTSTAPKIPQAVSMFRTASDRGRAKRKRQDDDAEWGPRSQRGTPMQRRSSRDSDELSIRSYSSRGRQNEAGVGLMNLGNTCYLNSALHAMRVLPEFAEAAQALLLPLSHDDEAKERVIKGLGGYSYYAIAEAAVKVMDEINTAEHKLLEGSPSVKALGERNAQDGVIEPDELVKKIRACDNPFNSHSQQDSHQVIMYLIDLFDKVQVSLHPSPVDSEGRLPSPPPSSPLGKFDSPIIMPKDLLAHTTVFQIECRECHTINSREVEAVDQVAYLFGNETIETALAREEGKVELMEGDNAYHCDKCNKKTSARRTQGMQDPPRILAVTVTRLPVEMKPEDTKAHKQSDTDGIVEMCLAGRKWSLCSAILRIGGTEGWMRDFGHYTAVARSKESRQWRLYDDSKVSPISEDDLYQEMGWLRSSSGYGESRRSNGSSAYVMFYEQVTGE